MAYYIPAGFIKRFATPHYAFAALAVAAAVGLRLALDPVLGTYSPYLPFLAAVLVAARLGGRGPALAATALSCLSVWYFFLEPRFSFGLQQPYAFVGLGLFVVISSAISFVETPGGLLSGRVAADRLEREYVDPVGTPLLGRIAMLAGAALALGILASLLWAGFKRTTDAERLVEHTYQVLNAAASVHSSLEQAESSQRGYLLTGNDRYLQAYQSAIESERRARSTLRRLTVDNLTQTARLEEFDRLVRDRLDLLARGIEVHRQQGAEAAAGLVRTNSGKVLMDRLRTILDAVDDEERLLLRRRSMAAGAEDSRTRWILGLGCGSLVFLLVLAGALIERHIHERKRAEKVLQHQARLIDLSHDAIITADGNRVITGWNAGAQEVYGWNETEAVGKTIHELLHTSSNIAIAEIDRVLAQRERWDGELDHTRADGRVIAVESRQVLLRDHAGLASGCLEINRDISARKQAEEALRQSEAQFRTLANAIPQLCWMANADGWIFWYNQRWYEYTGATPEGMEGWGWQSVHDPQTLPKVLERWQASIATGEPFDMVFPLRRADRVFRPFLTRVMPMRDQDGKVARWFGTNTDISEQRETEDVLREKSEQLRTALEAADLGAWEYRFDTGEVFWDESCRNLFGVTSGSQIDYGKAIERIHPEDRADTDAAVAQVLAGADDGKYHREFRVVWPDGSNHWVASNGRVYFHDDGGVRRARRFIGVNMDITTRKRADEALRESRAKLEAALASMTDAVFISDTEGRFIHFNDAFATFHRFRTKEECSKTLTEYPAILDVFFPDGTLAPPEMWAVPRSLRGEAVSNAEYTLRRKDSGESWVGSYSFGPIRDQDGLIVGSVVVGRDITDRKRAEEEIRQLNAELEQRVLERTAQLEASNKELEAFAYSVSHDLRAPLRGIDGWSLALVEDYAGQLDQRAHEYLDRVRSETQRMGHLIDDLLQLSRITRAEMHRKTVDLSLTAESIAARLRETHPERSLEFVIRPGLTALGDTRLLEIALTNLLHNAVKFTGPCAHARIEFAAIECDGKAAFAVRDNGVGFDMAYAGTLFGAFQRLHSDSEFPGTGIGLATVQRVIHRHGGRIWAEAEPGRGAAFYFTIGSEN